MNKKLDGAAAGTPRFQSDYAVDTDFFGSHERVAKAIAKVIDDAEDSRIIGLLGSWGSGKSTITKILERILTGESFSATRYCFFYYDAWLHQSDGPRRSFLESFIAFLKQRDPALKDLWQEDLDKLSRNLADTEVTTTPTLSFSGKWIAASLLPAALGWKWADKDQATVWGTCIPLSYVGFGLIALPAVAAFCAYLASRPIRLGRPNSFTRKNFTDPPKDGSTVFSIFVNKAVSTVKTRTIRTPEPTALEFQKLFRDVMAEVEEDGLSFVFVVDNLDRIPETEAISIWSTIRSFFINDEGHIALRGGSKPSTVVLPLDLNAIKRMYEKSGSDQTSLAQSFIDKTFDLVFHVSPPIQSGWQNYLEARLRATIATISKTEIFSVIYLYERYAEIHTRGVTPRNINSLIDQIAILLLQWHNDVPLATLAYYAIHKDAISADIAGSILEASTLLTRYDREYAESIAAVHFGVERHLALQVVVAPKISAAINAGDKATFKQLCQVIGSGPLVLRSIEGVLESRIDVSRYVTNAAALLSASEITASPIVDEINAALRRGINLQEQWTTINEWTDEGVTAVLSSASESEKVSLVDSIVVGLESIDAGATAGVDAALYWQCVFDETVNGCPAAWPNSRTIIVPGDATFFLDVLVCFDLSDKSLKHIRPQATFEDIAKALGAKATDREFDAGFSDTILRINESGMEFDFKPLADAAVIHLNNTSSEETGYLEAIECLGILRKSHKDTFRETSMKVWTNGLLFDRYYNDGDDYDAKIEAANLAFIILENPSLAVTTPAGNSSLGKQSLALIGDEISSDDEILQLLDDCLRRYGRFTDLLAAADENEQLSKVISTVLQYRLASNDIGPINIVDAINRFSSYSDLLPAEQHRTFARHLTRWATFWPSIKASDAASGRDELLSLLAGASDEIGTQARDEICRLAGELDADSWRKLLVSDDNLHEAIVTSSKIDPERFKFGEPLEKAIDEIIRSELKKSASDASLISAFGACALLDDSRLDFVLRGIRDVLLSGVSQPGMWNIFKAGGHLLLTGGRFADKADESIRHVIVPMIQKADTFLEWMTENKAEIKRWREKAPSPTKTYVRKVLVDLAGDHPSEEIKAVAQLLSVKLKTKSKPMDKD